MTEKLEEFTDLVCDFILGERDSLEPASSVLAEIADVETQGFSLLK